MSKNGNTANLALIALILVTAGCSCSKLAELGRKNSNSTSDPKRPVNSVATETGDWEDHSVKNGEYALTMDMYEKLKVGMSRSDAEAILGGKGTELSSSKGGGVNFSVNKWDGGGYKAIILSFKNDKIMTRSQVGLK